MRNFQKKEILNLYIDLVYLVFIIKVYNIDNYNLFWLAKATETNYTFKDNFFFARRPGFLLTERQKNVIKKWNIALERVEKHSSTSIKFILR